MSKDKMIVMMGGPGTGKGTFSKKMQNLKPDYNYIDTGAILRSMPPESEVRKIIAGGNLLPDKTVSAIVDDALSKVSGNTILDGFPRTIGQAQWLVENYANKYDIHVIFLNAPDDIMVKRIAKRRAEGSSRKDDSNVDIVLHRISAFHKTTMPAIQWLSGVENITFSDVDSSEEESLNFARILKALNWK